MFGRAQSMPFSMHLFGVALSDILFVQARAWAAVETATRAAGTPSGDATDSGGGDGLLLPVGGRGWHDQNWIE